MSRANGVHADGCTHSPFPCDRPTCDACTCDTTDALTTALSERDRARDIAVQLEGELARVREIVTAWSLGETSRDEMVLWAIRDIVGLTPAKPDNPTPWPHPDAVIAEGES